MRRIMLGIIVLAVVFWAVLGEILKSGFKAVTEDEGSAMILAVVAIGIILLAASCSS